jgi:hypothetical protein
LALEFASQHLRADEEIVAAAVKKHGGALGECRVRCDTLKSLPRTAPCLTRAFH